MTEDKDILGSERTFSESEFLNPGVQYRPLPVIHADEYSYTGVNTNTLNILKEYGYGGVVTNVSFNMYLQSQDMWESLERNIKYAIDTLGLRVWIYDELHYPSGSAGGLVLKDNPEWQAKGLVNDYHQVNQGAIFSKTAKYGHKLIIAKAFKGTNIDNINLSSEIDILTYADANGAISWSAPNDSNYFVILQYSKNFYEGTHAVNNWAQLRRAIDVLKAEPVKKFIDVTYEEYKKRFSKYFGNGIEAFFTDEPAMMGTYFPKPPTNPSVLDPIDPNITLEKTVNYTDNINDIFLQARGYSLESKTQYLFGGTSKEARRVRWDYYKTLAELMEKNYSKQIGDWCKDNSVSFSGHWLLEENIYMHPIFNGNLLQNMSHQDIPGIDLLTSYPANAVKWASVAAKFASSAAHFNGGYKTFSEISDAFDSVKTTVENKIGAAAVQYAMGINQFTSFYPYYELTEEENKLFANALGRMGYMVDKGVHLANVALYYPIESMYIDTLPPVEVNTTSSYDQNAVQISNNFYDLARQLVGNQIDYDIFDSKNLSECIVEDGLLKTKFGESFSVIIVPKTRALEALTVEKLLEARAKGVTVIMQNTSDILGNSRTAESTFNGQMQQLSADVLLKTAFGDIISTLKGLPVKSVTLSKDNFNLVATQFKFKDKSMYMLVNTETKTNNYQITVNSVGTTYKYWNIYTGEVQMLSSISTSGNTTSFSVSIPAGSAWLLTVE